MIILTTPEISKLEPTKMSSVVEYGYSTFCLAEVPDDFEIEEEEMDSLDITFWYPLTGSQIDPTEYRSSYKWKGGMPQAAMEDYNLSKERNIAFIIHSVAEYRDLTVWELWEKAIEK